MRVVRMGNGNVGTLHHLFVGLPGWVCGRQRPQKDLPCGTEVPIVGR